METWNKISKTLSNKVIAIIFVCVGLLGFLDSSYLTIGHFRRVIPPCSIVHGCTRVLTSQYSTIIGIPVALFGALYYLFILLTSLAHLEKKRGSLLLLAAQATTVGIVASIYFLALQVFVLRAYCLYCLGSISTSTLLFVVARFVKKTSAS